MEKKQVKVGYWTYEEFCKKFPDFDKIPVCDNYRPGRVAKFTNVKFASSKQVFLFAILRKTILNLKHSANCMERDANVCTTKKAKSKPLGKESLEILSNFAL